MLNLWIVDVNEQHSNNLYNKYPFLLSHAKMRQSHVECTTTSGVGVDYDIMNAETFNNYINNGKEAQYVYTKQ